MLLGQRRRRRGDDAAGRRVGQRLERDQRARHGVATSRPMRAPSRPSRARTPRCCERVLARRTVRRRPGATAHSVSTNGTRLALRDGEVGDGRESLSPRIGTGVRSISMSGPAIARQRAVLERGHPRHRRRRSRSAAPAPVRIAHLAALADHDAHESEPAIARRHEVDDRDARPSAVSKRVSRISVSSR